jgi:uncharacterized sulfatase
MTGRRLAHLAATLACLVAAPVRGADRPNILWISSEDNGPHLGCYGDAYADTPNLDALAARGVVYTHCWSNAPVCAPARTTIITGLYPTATGAEHMRSMTRLPEGFGMFPQRLRTAGYYCTNHTKEDYNLEKPGRVWDESGRKAHWRNRPVGAPFFAVFNFATTHESRIRKRPHEAVHDPALVRVPAYHPDAPEVRQDWAQYHDMITRMDRQVGRVLAELEADGLADDTIVFYFADHGSGMPRSKRSPCSSGLRVPLIVHVPERFRDLASPAYGAGRRDDRLVSFVDFAPTVLSIAGIAAPEHYHGRAFMGAHAADAPAYLFGFRARMDERYDLQRSVFDGRYVYVRNYMPHLPAGQHVAYMFQTPTTRVWHERFLAGSLTPAQQQFWQPKPPEELFDLREDPDEVRNLAGSPAHRQILERLRGAQQGFSRRTRDLGFLPEDDMHRRAQGTTPYAMGHDDARYPLDRVMATAETASMLADEATPALVEALGDGDAAVRTWAALGLLMRGAPAVEAGEAALRRALTDPSPSVRVTAAHALAKYGPTGDRAPALNTLAAATGIAGNGIYVTLLALNAIDDLDGRAADLAPVVRALPGEEASVHPRLQKNVDKLVEKILADLER